MSFDLERWLARAQVQGIKLGLDNIRGALAALGDPQRSYPSALVGGTNGKGSTVAFAVAILKAMGLRVGSTVSPHLTEYRERFLVGGEPVAQDDLERLAAGVAERIDGDPRCPDITFFELGVALALEWFAQQSVDVAVVEVGMGGEYDATRACGPVACAITTVDLDHVKHLGPTLADIAGTKARVLDPGGVLVVGENRPDRLRVIQREVEALGGSVVLRERDFSITEAGGGLRYRSRGLEVDGLRLGLRGRHQRANAATAVALVEALCARSDLPPPAAEAVRQGLANPRLAGRQEARRLRGVPVLLDGAHNPAGALTLAESLAEAPRPPRRVWLYAAMNDKDRGPILDALLPHVDAVWCTRGASTPRFEEPDVLADEVRARGGEARVFASVPEALAAVPGDLGELLVAGSLYLVGDVRPLLDPA